MQNRIDRLTMSKSIVDQSDIPAGCCRVELEVRDWMNVIRMIVSGIDAFDEVVGGLLVEGRFGRGPYRGRGVPEKGMVSVIAHGYEGQGHCWAEGDG